MAVTFEYTGGPRFNVTASGWTVELDARVDWDDLDLFLASLFPPTTGSGTLFQQRATFPGRPYLVLESANLAPHQNEGAGPADASGVPTYPSAGAFVTLVYKTQEFATEAAEGNDPVPWLTHRWTISAEVLRMKGAGLEWDDGSSEKLNDDAGGAGKIVAQVDHVLTWHQVVNPPETSIRSLIGHVNQNAFAGAAAETLMFGGGDITRETMSNGDRSATVEYRFSERVIAATSGDVYNNATAGWNHQFKPFGASNAGKWVPVKTANGGKPYPTTDSFSNLFKSA